MSPRLSKQKVYLRPAPGPSLPLAIRILENTKHHDQFAYEHESTWFLGIGRESSLEISPDGLTSTIITNASTNTTPITKDLSEIARDFISQHADSEQLTFGQVGFNFAAQCRHNIFTPGLWPLLVLVVPKVYLAIHAEYVEISSSVSNCLQDDIERLLERLLCHDTCPTQDRLVEVDLAFEAEDYKDEIDRAKEGIAPEVSLSLSTPVTEMIDMIRSLQHGHMRNSPRHSFFFNQLGCQTFGFSSQRIMSLENRRLTSEPLIGARTYDIEELRIDPKETMEHTMSVKEAVLDMQQLCAKDTTVVEDFTPLRPHDGVQNSGSRVTGVLEDDKDGWEAFKVIFPSITASRIAKQSAPGVIGELEMVPMELHSGAVLMLQGSFFFRSYLSTLFSF